MSRQQKIDPSTNPSLYSYGSNSLNSKRVFQERERYDNYVFPDFMANNFIKTWTTDRFYGTINHKGYSVLPNTRRLKSLPFVEEESESLYAIDFVVDAWYDFALKLKELADNNIIYRDSPWAKPFAVKAWTPISAFYDDYMRATVYPAFFTDFMSSNGNDERLRNIDNFIDLIGEFVEDSLLKAGPVTLSGIVESQKTPLYASGLVIELSSDDYDDDFNKAYKFGDANFALVANLASQYGFSIDKNIPWRLVADLRNPAMLEYMLGVPIEGFNVRDNVSYVCEPFVGDVELPPRAYGFSQIPGLEDVVRHVSFFKYLDANDEIRNEPGYKRYKTSAGGGWEPIFNTQDQRSAFVAMFERDYSETWSSDMQIFEQYLLDFYNFYISQKPTILVQKLGSFTDDCPPYSRTVQRSQITKEEFNQLYSYRWKLKTFYVIRLLERQYQIPIQRRKYEIQQAMDVYNIKSRNNPEAAYLLALQVIQDDFLGPADTDPLTIDFVGDILNS
jgi:hypothetical protein